MFSRYTHSPLAAPMNRREMLARAGLGFGSLALTMLLLAPARVLTQSAEREVTILYTNDFHSAMDPIPAYWLPGSPRLGGAAVLAGYVNRIRDRDSTVFLFDAGDMFTGLISNLTRGEALMEMMREMRYDAFAIGNHEFDYGSAVFEREIYRRCGNNRIRRDSVIMRG